MEGFATTDAAEGLEGTDAASEKMPYTNAEPVSLDLFSIFAAERYAFRMNKVCDRFGAPTNQYFKLFFDFTSNEGLLSSDFDSTGYSSNLPSDTEQLKNPTMKNYKRLNFNPGALRNNAYTYLMNIGETNRAEEIRRFNYLLSDISSNSPWFFQSISGLDQVIGRDFGEDKKENKLVIKCLCDSVDQRIATLLDLYTSACWSEHRKCEVCPPNIRRFNMSILIFQQPVRYVNTLPFGFSWPPKLANGDPADHRSQVDSSVMSEYWQYVRHSVNTEKSMLDPSFRASSKWIDLIGCEINQASSGTGYSELNNAEGSQPTFDINLSFKRAYVYSYSQFMGMEYGDYQRTDLFGDYDDQDTYLDKDQYSTAISGDTGTHRYDWRKKAAAGEAYDGPTTLAGVVAGAVKTAVVETAKETFDKFKKSTGIPYMLQNPWKTLGNLGSKLTSSTLGNVYHGSLFGLASAIGEGNMQGLAAASPKLNKLLTAARPENLPATKAVMNVYNKKVKKLSNLTGKL